MTKRAGAKRDVPKHAAVYCRISKDPEGRELGVGRQEEDCRKLAERLGLEIVAVYVDNDVSASTRSTKPRPQYQDMMDAAKRGNFKAILAYSNSRLTRRPAEFIQLIELHDRHGVDIHTVASGSVDLAWADGRAVALTIAVWDGAEAERVSERVTRAKLQQAEQGKDHGGTRRFGWDRDSIHANPAEKAIVQEWAHRILSGDSLISVRRDMEERGVPTVTGARWHAEVIKTILTSPRMAGWRTRHGEIVAKGQWEPLLDEGTWQELRLILTDPARDTSTRARVHLLTSLALCGHCEKPVGIKVRGAKTGAGYWCRTCGMRRQTRLIDVHVEAYMVELLTNLQDLPEPDTPSGAAVSELRQRIKNNVVRFADSDVLSDAEFEMVQRRLKDRLAKEEAKLAVPRRQRLVLGMTGPQAAESWQAAPLERKRSIIDAFVEVRLYRGRSGSNTFDPASVDLLDK